MKTHDTVLNFGIIGAGSRGFSCFGKLLDQHQNARLAAYCDPNLVRARNTAANFQPSPNCYTEINEMINEEELDAVIIASPDYCHEENAIEVLQRGINILIDKPLAINVKACQNIIAAAKRHQSVAYMGFNLRHDPTLKSLKAMIEDNLLGRIILIENREFGFGGRTYMSRWNRKYELSGGLWVHKGSHDFDIFNWLLDFPQPKKVSAFAGVNVFTPDNLPFPLEENQEPGPICDTCHYRDTCPDTYLVNEEQWGDDARKVDDYAKNLCMYTSEKDVHDNGVAIVEYENGVRASHLECFVIGESASDRKWTVVGTKASAEISLVNRTIVVTPRWGGGKTTYEVPSVEGSHGGSDPALLEDFIAILSGEKETANSRLKHGLLSTAIGQAAEIARREERIVMMSELL